MAHIWVRKWNRGPGHRWTSAMFYLCEKCDITKTEAFYRNIPGELIRNVRDGEPDCDQIIAKRVMES